MAENQPDEDDDVGFGDFKFVSYSNHPLQTHQTKRVDEDEWGDFMGNFSQKQEFLGNPLRFDSLNGFTPTQNPIKPPEISQKLDLFGVFSDPSTNNPESKLGHVESEKSPVTPVVEKGWEKPRGALPLSIFGDEEEESDSVNPSFSNAADMFSSKSAATVQNGFNFGAGVGLDDLIGNLYSQAEQIKTDNGSNSNRVDGDGDFDDEGWEFKEALSENGVGDNNSVVKVENSSGLEMTSGLWEVQVETTTFDGDFQVDGKQSKNSEGTLHASVFSNIEPDSGDSFVASNGFSHTFDNGLGLETSVITQNGFVLDSLDQTKQISTENGLSSCSVDGNVGTDDNLWEFKDALSETGAVNCHKGNGEGLGYQEEAPPLSIFSNGKLDSNDSLYGEDVSSENPATHLRNGTYRQGSSPNVSFSDLLSTLYTQAEQISSVGSTGKPTENGINSAETVVNSDLVSREDDSDKNSWNFKYAFSETKTANIALGVDKKFMSESKLKNFTDLYSRLKDESHFVALRHLDGLKKAQKVTALSSEGVKAVALEEEIQAAYKILHQENVVSEEVSLEELSTRNICMDQFMHMPKFDILESEYDLSKRISLADKDLTSAIELFEHAIWMLKILTMGTMEEQSKYVTTWSKMISACAQELKYGASIWKQLLLKNVHKKILSELQAQRYFLALGEIYRVVEVLRASTTLYKPWILSSIVDHSVIFSLLEECMDVWSDSGLEGAIMSISDLISPGYDGTIKALMESIRSVHDLDVLSLQNCAFSQRESVCRLSGLSLSVVPDMKIVVWDGEHYFLTLANLWANRISSDPPQLPHLHDG